MQQQTYPKVELKEFKAFAVWQWKSEELNKNCAICKKPFTEACIDCEHQLQVQDQQDECVIAQGLCGHVFHKHCIEKWIKEGSKGGHDHKCGMCDQNWDLGNQIIIEP